MKTFREFINEKQEYGSATKSVKGMINVKTSRTVLNRKYGIKELFYDKTKNEFWQGENEGWYLALLSQNVIEELIILLDADNKSVKKLQPYKDQIIRKYNENI